MTYLNSIESEPENPVSVDQTPLSTPVNLDSDLEAGALVIDEGDKKRQLKRKSLATPVVGFVSFLFFFSLLLMGIVPVVSLRL